jgi:hypothetical protein
MQRSLLTALYLLPAEFSGEYQALHEHISELAHPNMSIPYSSIIALIEKYYMTR